MSLDHNRKAAIEYLHTMDAHDGVNTALVTPDFKWWSAGTGVMDITKGKEIVSGLRPIMPKLPEFTIVRTVAEDDYVSVEFTGKCVLANGKRYDNRYHFIFKFRDGLIEMMNEYNDTRLARECLYGE